MVRQLKWELNGFAVAKCSSAKFLNKIHRNQVSELLLLWNRGKKYRLQIAKIQYVDNFGWPDVKGFKVKREEVGGEELCEKFNAVKLLETL